METRNNQTIYEGMHIYLNHDKKGGLSRQTKKQSHQEEFQADVGTETHPEIQKRKENIFKIPYFSQLFVC